MKRLGEAFTTQHYFNRSKGKTIIAKGNKQEATQKEGAQRLNIFQYLIIPEIKEMYL